MRNSKETVYNPSEEFKNLAFSEAEMTANLENQTDSYYALDAAKKFVKSRLYVGLAVRMVKWSWSTSDDYRCGVSREVLAMNLVSGEVLWVVDGGGEDFGYGNKNPDQFKGSIQLNATPEQRKEALAWLMCNGGTNADVSEHKSSLVSAANYARQVSEEHVQNSLRISKGSNVKVVRGRKIPVGTTGVVVWMGNSQYGPRIGLSPSGNRVGKIYPDVVWTAEDNVELNDPLLEASATESSKVIYEKTLAEKIASANKSHQDLMKSYETLLR